MSILQIDWDVDWGELRTEHCRKVEKIKYAIWRILLVYDSLAFCEFRFEESDFVYFAISSRYPKTLSASASRNHTITLHDPLLARMRDIGIWKSGFASLGYVYNYIETPLRNRDIGGEDRALMYSNTRSLAARGDELERDSSDIACLPVGESDRVEFEHMIFWWWFQSPGFTFWQKVTKVFGIFYAHFGICIHLVF